MNELKITLSNCPPQIALMFNVAFKDVPLQMDEAPVDLPMDSLAIDFNDITDPEMVSDLITAAHKIILAQGWLAIQKRTNE